MSEEFYPAKIQRVHLKAGFPAYGSISNRAFPPGGCPESGLMRFSSPITATAGMRRSYTIFPFTRYRPARQTGRWRHLAVNLFWYENDCLLSRRIQRF